MARKVAYDVYYVERINLWLDLRILVGTALKMAGIPTDISASSSHCRGRKSSSGSVPRKR